MYWSGAGSEAVAATTTVYSIAPYSSKVLTTCAKVERFCPVQTYIQKTSVFFWLIIASIAIAVFPVCLSPMISSL